MNDNKQFSRGHRQGRSERRKGPQPKLETPDSRKGGFIFPDPRKGVLVFFAPPAGSQRGTTKKDTSGRPYRTATKFLGTSSTGQKQNEPQQEQKHPGWRIATRLKRPAGPLQKKHPGLSEKVLSCFVFAPGSLEGCGAQGGTTKETLLDTGFRVWCGQQQNLGTSDTPAEEKWTTAGPEQKQYKTWTPQKFFFFFFFCVCVCVCFAPAPTKGCGAPAGRKKNRWTPGVDSKNKFRDQ